MSGALVDLVAIGVQDTYLTGDPQTTYFRQAYKRHTNFAMEPVRQVIEGDISTGAWSQVNISRNGDLLTDVYFLYDSTGIADGKAPFEEVQLFIGGQKIDTITREENVACAQVFRPRMSSQFLTAANVSGVGNTAGSHSLQFFFGRGYSSALPMCALQYHDITLRIKWAVASFAGSIYGDFIQLDTQERNAFASKPITMLVEQHQRTPFSVPAGTGSSYTSLEFSHPVKAIYTSNVNADDTLGYPVDSKMKIEFNGKTRTPSLPTENYYVDHQLGKHTEYGAVNTLSASMFPMYSFALYANRLSPTGSCNFSRLDNARVSLIPSTPAGAATGYFYALGWNFLKIEDGMGGLLFAN